MCRTLEEGGRRCPTCFPPRRSARDRARYAAKRAAAADGGAAAGEVIAEYSPPAGEVLTEKEIGSRILQIQDTLLEGDPGAHEELAGWAGSPLHAISRVGASIANDAELDAGIDSLEVSQDLGRRADAAREQIFRLYDTLRAEVDELKAASRELGWLQGQQRLVDQLDGGIVIDGLGEDLRRARTRLDAAERNLTDAGEPYDLERLHHEHSLLVQAEDEQTQGELAVLAISYRESLGRHVDLGRGGLLWHPDSDPEASRMLESVSSCFPASWITAGSDGHPVHATMTTDRGSYRDAQVTPRLLRTISLPPGLVPPDTGLTAFVEDPHRSGGEATVWHEIEMEFHEGPGGALTISPVQPDGSDWMPHGPVTGGYLWRRPATQMVSPPRIETTAGSGHFRAAVHELAHRFESLVPELGVAQEAFVRRRTMLPSGGQQRPVAMFPDQVPVELVRPDRFVTAYIGRDYGNGTHHEVLSTGVEALFGGRFGGLVAGREDGPDVDHRGFVLGLLASVPGVESPGRRRV